MSARSPLPDERGDAFLIVDYNLTRVDDVRAMRAHLRTQHGLRTLLIRREPRALDVEIADAVVDLDPCAPDFVERALEVLVPIRTRLRGGVVFSDDAVASGARLLERLGLAVDDARLADAAHSKLTYRARERFHRELFAAQGVSVPHSRTVERLSDFTEFLKRFPDGVVLKPACEGNNRGVVVLRSGDDLSGALPTVGRYLAGGVICEQLIPYEREFSYDGIGTLWFVTEKLRASGRYPVETGQIVPARLDAPELATIRRAGMLANLIVGQSEGPFHNEIRLSDDGARAAVVEPNRRPAGMRIWQLAHAVYGIDFFAAWIDHALGRPLPERLPPARGRAMSIMLGVPRDGILHVDRLPDARALLEHEITPALRARALLPRDTLARWLDVRWLGTERDRHVRALPIDNGDFVGCASLHVDRDDLDLPAVAAFVQHRWRQALEPCITPDVRPLAVARESEHGATPSHLAQRVPA